VITTPWVVAAPPVHRRWLTLGLVLPVSIVCGLLGLIFVPVGIFGADVTAAGRGLLIGLGVLLLFVCGRSAIASFIVTNDYVRVRGVWATRTVPRALVAGFVMECDSAGDFHFPTVVADDGRRIRARWAFRRAGKDSSRNVTQEITETFKSLGLYDEVRLDTALNRVDAVRRDAVTSYRWNTPPGWPSPPPNWRPPPGWQPPPQWPPAPTDWIFWEQVASPVVMSADVEADPAESPIQPLPRHLDPRFALDIDVAKGLPNSNWGLGEVVQSFGWLALLIAVTVVIGVYINGDLAGVFGECSIGLAVVLSARKAAGQSGGWGRALGWELPKFRQAWLGFRWWGWNMLARVVVGILLGLITIPIRGGAKSNVDVSRHDRIGTIILIVVIAVIAAPIVEEFYFRGLLLRAAMRRFSFWPSAVVTSLLFGAAHVPQVNGARAMIILGGTISVFGLVQCLLARRRTTLGANMWVHGLANGFVVLIAIL
jgi:membrane protease YdiL (CAAX protease family)